jgi:hypothetical protein
MNFWALLNRWQTVAIRSVSLCASAFVNKDTSAQFRPERTLDVAERFEWWITEGEKERPEEEDDAN